MLDEKIKRGALHLIASVKCEVCGEVHNAEGDTYVAFYGDVMVGMKLPLVEGNVNEKGKLEGSTVYCRNEKCLKDMLSKMLGGEVSVSRPREKAD
jgi:hypothetical protein